MTKTDDMARDYASSKFCLAAPGGGWGKRGIVSAMWVVVWAGCFHAMSYGPAAAALPAALGRSQQRCLPRSHWNSGMKVPRRHWHLCTQSCFPIMVLWSTPLLHSTADAHFCSSDILNPTLDLHICHRYGCIPVAATDFLYEAFEPELDWGHFGVKVAQRDIPKLG